MISHPLETISPKYTALALNYYLPKFFGDVWDKATNRVCADGGANRIYKFFEDSQRNFIKPTAVVGDFDSVKPHVRDLLTKEGTHFEHVENQDYNDLQKALTFISKNISDKEPILVFGAFGGRMDHTLAALHCGLERPDLMIYYIDDNNFSTWIFPKDKGVITPMKWTNNVCGLIPVGEPVHMIHTKGLKWECDFGLSMGTFVSSSNEIVSEKVEIETSHPILWTNQTRPYEELPKLI